MANIKIAQLTNQINIADTDLMLIESATSTNKMTVGKFKELLDRKSQRFNITRDATLAGTQTISALQGAPKKITILAAIDSSNKLSIGMYSKFDDKQFCLRIFNMATAFVSYDYAILMHGASLYDFIIGTITNVTNTSFDINWTINGTPPTGTITVGISVDY